MRAGLIASTVGHLAILVWGVISFPDARPFEVAPVDSLPVELVPISELTKLRVGEKTAELREEEAPKPTEKKAEKPPVPDAKTGDAKAEQPTPATKQATAQPAEAKPAPTPPPAPAPEPPAPEKTAEPAPAPPAPQPEKAPAPVPEKAEEPKKVAEAPPVNVKPRSKPAPPPKVQQTARAREPEKKQDDFNPNQIAALLNKVDPSGGGTQSSSEPASLGSERGQSNVQMSQSELDALRSQIARCWNPPIGAAGADDLNVRLKVSLTPGGDVDLSPQVLNSSGNPSFNVAAESARRAVLRCAPYSLPTAKYEAWREVIINFDPRELLGG
ncbi:cell envelope biogenesis protein TolA [Rhizobiales bacterium]|uniref:cell envelope integrity protein TolA n=1 Tax=Hongsoonwoonella zoysiae TaxID=2821844 RepID=UPI001560099D|nr:cell envelope integrity protein TolA [Hongsoonwoonella zoysiae]NRG17389.1 cell envelope biogenesis protein TolA [Hongsoonwoonella zoysiae]